MGFFRHSLSTTSINQSLFLMILVVGIGLSDISWADDEPQSGASHSAINATFNQSPQMSPIKERRSSRLRFKDGPVCLCADGLQEDDILNARKPKTSSEQKISGEKTATQ